MTALLSTSFHADSSVIQYSNATWARIGSGYLTRDPNATAIFSFTGTMLAVAGTVQSDQNFNNSPLSYVLDGEDDLTFLFNASSPVIYSSPEMSQGHHTLSIRLLSENTSFTVSGGNITTSQPIEADGSHHRTIAIVAGTLGGCIVLAVLILGLFIYRRRQRQYPSMPYALGPLQVTMPSTKEAFTSPKYSNHGIIFTQSTDSVNVLPRTKTPTPIPDAYESPTKPPRPKPAAQRMYALSP
ncbi:hypothetical protein MSAN_00650000 [Mycena sanguinolenta]|uniref:Uncharacterized protein n=1 Tax=Mycena sanguinolenta TaxID=230812 RepID=A0A8H6Z0Y5_9AGAR|nr:hypothetical protein MSAN_00650000 [Mycena sanguinolenta]